RKWMRAWRGMSAGIAMVAVAAVAWVGVGAKGAGAAETSANGVGWVQSWTQDYLAANNSHDIDQIFGLYDDDIVLNDAGWPTPLVGKEALRPYYVRLFTAFPDVE